MNSKGKSVWNAAAVGVLAVAMSTSAFATPAPARGDNNRGNDNRDSYDNRRETRNEGRTDSRSYRDNQRVNTSGRVTSLSRENGGYRVQLDRGRDSYWIPESRVRNHRNDLRVGISVVLGGVFRGGRIDVDAVSWPGDGGYRNGGYGNDDVRGVVERVDYRDGVLLLRDASTRQTIEVDMRDTRRSSRIDFSDLRRGDYVELSGQWLRGGRFVAEGIDSVDSRR